MGFKRRRKPKVLWLPVHGRDFTAPGETTNFANGLGGDLTVNNTGAISTDIQECTFDYSDSAEAEEGVNFRSLHDLTSGSAYRLRRIVGKFHAAAISENNSLTDLGLVDLAAGFIVNRTDDSGNLLDQTTWSGVTDITSGPLAQDGAEDPWIWRRRWFLSTVPAAIRWPTPTASLLADVNDFQSQTGGQGQFPQTTAHYGSVHDGPHIDQKTARVIGRQERLYFWVQARICNPGSTTNNARIIWNLDLRLLASLRFQQGNRRNASR